MSSFAGGFAKGFASTNALSPFETKMQLQQREKEQEAANKQKEQEFVTKTLNGASEQFKPILEQRQQPTYQATPESEANYKTTVTSYYKPVIEMARNAQANGLAVPPPEFFESQMNSLLNAPHGGQIQETTLANKEDELRVTEEVKAEFKSKSELETLASLNVKKDLTPEDAQLKKLLTDKLTTGADGNKIAARTVTVPDAEGNPIIHGIDTKNGGLVPLENPTTGLPAINATEARQRQSQNRLEGISDRNDRKEIRLTLKQLDTQYKDFANKSKTFMNQMDAYNALVDQAQTDKTSVDQSVLDQTLSMAYIRSIKPTGTVSSGKDFDSIDELRSVPEAIRVFIRGAAFDGKTLPPRVRDSITKLLSNKYVIAKDREASVIKNGKTRAEKAGVSWTPPIYVPSKDGSTEIPDDELDKFFEETDDDLINKYL